MHIHASRTFRRWLAVLLSLGLLVLVPGAALAAGDERPFADVPSDAPYARAVELLYRLRIVEGVAPGTYRPDGLVTREQFAAFVVRALGRDRVARSLAGVPVPFKDAGKVSGWARGYVVLASSMGVITGFPDGTFRPQEKVTYAQALAMLVRALGFDAYARGLGGWPAGYLAAAEDLGLTRGLEGWSGNLPIHRAGMAVATFNAVAASYEPVRDPQGNIVDVKAVDKGAASLLRKVFAYTEAQYDEVTGAASLKVSGTVEALFTASKRIKVAGQEFTYDANTAVVVNRKDAGTGTSAVEAHVAKDYSVTVEHKDGRAIKVSVTRDTFPNKLASESDITVTAGETMYGTVSKTVTGSTYDINVTQDTEIVLDGKPATLADVKNALKRLATTYGSSAKGIVTIRTYGNDSAAAAPADAVYLSVITANTISGKVTALGTDSGGNYMRIKPDGASEQKVYYASTVAGVNAGDTVTLLLDSGGTARVALKVTPASAGNTQVFWARAAAVEYTGTGSATYLVRISVDGPVTATYAGAQDSSGAYTTVVNLTYAGANKVVAIELDRSGKVSRIFGFGDPAWPGSLADDVADPTKQSTLFWGDDAAAIVNVAGVYRITTAAAPDGGTVDAYASGDVAILQSDGTPSRRTLADITKDDIDAVFYVRKGTGTGAVRSVQLILLKNMDP